MYPWHLPSPGLRPELWAQPGAGAGAARGWPCGAAAVDAGADAGAHATGLHGNAAGDAGTSIQRCARERKREVGGGRNGGFMVLMSFVGLKMNILKLKTPS